MAGGKTELVIFDLDGTLMDAYRPVWQSMNFALKQAGFPAVSFATVRRAVGWGDTHLIEGFVGRANLKKVLTVYRRHHAKNLAAGCKRLPGAIRLLRYLKEKGFRLAVASNRPTRYSHLALRALGFRDYFHFVLCGDRVRRPKPHPEILKNILKRFSLLPKQALYVGDMTIDLETGSRAGVRTVAVTTGSSTRKELARLKPYRLIRRVDEVIGVVEKLNKQWTQV